jgi:DNA-binding MarR family transcriptional regulator
MGPFVGSLSRVVWLWVRREIYARVVEAGYDDLNPAHVGMFRNPSIAGRRPSDLAEDMQITKQSVNGLLGDLEARGYLVRARDPDDSRSRRIELTERGQQLEAVTMRAAEQAERDAAKLIGAERMRELRSILIDLVAQLPNEGLVAARKRPGEG